MRRTTENRGNIRTLTECFPPRNKVKDLVFPECSRPRFSPFVPETPMKPSLLPNRLSHPPHPRRVPPPQSPDRGLAPPRRAAHPPGPIRLLRNVAPPGIRSQTSPAARPAPLQHQQPPGPFSGRSPVSPYNSSTTVNSSTNSSTTPNRSTNSSTAGTRPPGICAAASPAFMKDLSNHSASQARRDQRSESSGALSRSGSKPVTPQRRETHKVQGSDAMIQLHRRPTITSISPSDRSPTLPSMHCSVASCQDKQHLRTSSENVIPVVDLSCSSQKRIRESDGGESSAKKLCLPGVSSTVPRAAAGNSVSTQPPPSGQVLVSELPPKTTGPARTEQSSKPAAASCTPPRTCTKTRPPSLGLKQAFIDSSHNNTLVLRLPTKPAPHAGVSPRAASGSHHSHRGATVKHPSRGHRAEDSSSTPKPLSQSARTIDRHKPPRPRRPVAIPNDLADLFTPDPRTYVVSSCPKTAKNSGIKSPAAEKTPSASSGSAAASSCRKTASPHAAEVSSSPLALPPLPLVVLERVKLETLKPVCSKDRELTSSPSGRQLQEKSVKSDEEHAAILPDGENAAGRRSPDRPHSEEDPIDVELDLSLALGLDLTQSSNSSSEEEPLLSLQEMMACVTKPPDTPEKGAFSAPSTPGRLAAPPTAQRPAACSTKSVIYKNNLDQMLKEIHNSKNIRDMETQLQAAWSEEQRRLVEEEQEHEEQEEQEASTEQQEFLQRYCLMSRVIREVPPGESVFDLQKFGRIFDHETLQLRRFLISPQGTAQKTLLWSSPAQLRLHVNIGLFQEAYDCRSPCPAQVTRFLFRMMSVHSETLISEKILQALCDISCTAAHQIVKNGSQQFQVWVPSLADVVLVLMNMGVSFVTLFPCENLQPTFSEADLLEDIYINSDRPSRLRESCSFPEHNYNNILKYVFYCLGLCPGSYSDEELLLLLTAVTRVGLDTRLILRSRVDLYHLQYKIINNVRDWDAMLPRMCLSLTELMDDHHNMCLLVQLLPDNTRGKQLRRHASLSMISKLLDGTCTYTPTRADFQLRDLRPFLPRMRPSSLLRGLTDSSGTLRDAGQEDAAALDQQSYYLCYSLLTLANEASNFQYFPPQQKKQLLFLCSELETHVKCDIRESAKCLYRIMVKDLVARIYTKWQMLLRRTRPLHGQLYDYWQPLLGDTPSRSRQGTETDNRDHRHAPVTDQDAVTIDEGEGHKTTEDTSKTGGGTETEEMEDTNKMRDDVEREETEDTNETDRDDAPEDTKETEDVTETVCGELDKDMWETEPQTLRQTEDRDSRQDIALLDERTET